MGLSRNKVAVPEGAAGTPPFWRGVLEEEILEDLENLESLENLDNLENLENLEKSDLRKRKEAARSCPPVCLFCCHSLYSEKGDAEVASPVRAGRPQLVTVSSQSYSSVG